MIKNRKGFTLVELLAVITILGIVMLIAVVAVIPMISKSRQKALLDEAKSLVKAADLAYAANELNLRGKNVVYSLDMLNELGYYEKSGKDGYVGSVKIVKEGNAYTKRVWIASTSGYGYKNLNINDENPTVENFSFNNIGTKTLSQYVLGGESVELFNDYCAKRGDDGSVLLQVIKIVFIML